MNTEHSASLFAKSTTSTEQLKEWLALNLRHVARAQHLASWDAGRKFVEQKVEILRLAIALREAAATWA